jgi:hypothetical protein
MKDFAALTSSIFFLRADDLLRIESSFFFISLSLELSEEKLLSLNSDELIDLELLELLLLDLSLAMEDVEAPITFF